MITFRFFCHKKITDFGRAFSKSLWSRVDLLHKSLVDVADNYHYLFYQITVHSKVVCNVLQSLSASHLPYIDYRLLLAFNCGMGKKQ